MPGMLFPCAEARGIRAVLGSDDVSRIPKYKFSKNNFKASRKAEAGFVYRLFWLGDMCNLSRRLYYVNRVEVCSANFVSTYISI